MKRHKDRFPVVLMSKVLEVSKSGYYKWCKSKKVNKYNDLDNKIRHVFDSSNKTYGSPRIADALGHEVSKNTIARRMSKMKLVARPKKKYVLTTDSKHGLKVSPNLLERNCDVDQPNKIWVSDITYIRVGTIWMYLTIILDLADRMIVGWSLSKTMTAQDTVVKSFRHAVRRRSLSKKSSLLFHSDRGVQYACEEFRVLLHKYGCVQSMSRRANCWDNAVAESFFKTIKIECTNRYIFMDEHALYTTLFRYIDGWYNTKRIHSSLEGKSPLERFNSLFNKHAA